MEESDISSVQCSYSATLVHTHCGWLAGWLAEVTVRRSPDGWAHRAAHASVLNWIAGSNLAIACAIHCSAHVCIACSMQPARGQPTLRFWGETEAERWG